MQDLNTYFRHNYIADILVVQFLLVDYIEIRFYFVQDCLFHEVDKVGRIWKEADIFYSENLGDTYLWWNLREIFRAIEEQECNY